MVSKLRSLIDKRRIVALDTETFGNIKKTSVYHPSIRLAYVSYWTSEGRGGVLSYRENPDAVIETVRSFFLPENVVVFWNAAFDLTVLGKEELRPTGCIVQDAMVLAQTVHPTEPKHGLKEFARKFLKVPYLEEDNLKKYMRRNKCDYGSVPIEVMEPYALADAQYTFELYYLMLQSLDRLDMWPTWELETKVQRAVLEMQNTGVRIDADRVHELTVAAQSARSELKTFICKELGNPRINLNSGPQIAAALWPDRSKVRRFTDGGAPSTDNLALLLDGRPVALAIQRYRQYNKALTNYYKALANQPQGGVLHCGLNQNRAVTGRFSSSKPNLQNQPRPSSSPLGRIRECFVPHSKDSFLLLIDYDQIELRLVAHFGKEQHMIEAIHKGEDLHGVTRDRMFNLEGLNDEDRKSRRYLAKRLNFATVYGTGPAKFANTTLEDSGGAVRLDLGEASTFISKWWDVHPGIAELRNRVLSNVARTGGVRTHFGRFIPVLPGKDHAALNYLIQGTAADVIKRAIVRVRDLLKRERARTRMLLPVHDELIFDMHRSEKHLVPLIVEAMEFDSREFDVPLTCSVEAGLRWGTKKPVSLQRRTSK